MARTRCPFTKEAVTRVLKAVLAAGVEVRIEIDTATGKIVLLMIESADAEPESAGSTEIVL
jgi:hypothetical protein